MMKWKKAPEALVKLFDGVFPDDARAERRQMFGYPAGFVNGNMFAGLHEERFVVRLGDADRARLLAVDGATTFEPMKGRPMREYVVLPRSILDDAAELSRWLGRALAHGAALPPKAKKGAAKKTAPAKKSAPKGRRR